jgi:hypothetical protein
LSNSSVKAVAAFRVVVRVGRVRVLRTSRVDEVEVSLAKGEPKPRDLPKTAIVMTDRTGVIYPTDRLR